MHQFSLRNLFALVAIAAVVMAVYRVVGGMPLLGFTLLALSDDFFQAARREQRAEYRWGIRLFSLGFVLAAVCVLIALLLPTIK